MLRIPNLSKINSIVELFINYGSAPNNGHTSRPPASRADFHCRPVPQASNSTWKLRSQHEPFCVNPSEAPKDFNQ